MKLIDFNFIGGFPLTQHTLQYMQESYLNTLSALAAYVGDSVIVSGMLENSGNVADGWVIISGELMPFLGGVKQSTVVVITETGDEVFEDDNTRTVYFKKYARFGAGDITYSDLKRLSTLSGIDDSVKMLTSSLSIISDQFAAHLLSENPHGVTKAQVGLGNLPNVKSDDTNLNDSNVLATARAVNDLRLATESENRILYVASYPIGDISTDKLVTVTHSQNIVVPYMPVCTLRGKSADWDDDNDVMFVVRNVSANSFQVAIREVSNNVQNLELDYMLVRKN